MLHRFRKVIERDEQEGSVADGVASGKLSLLSPSACNSIHTALYNRRQVTRDIQSKIGQIQDASLDEQSIRRLNDELNKLVRQHHDWNHRLIQLGHVESDRAIKWGDVCLPEPGNKYQKYYFGRAKELPEVKDLLNPLIERRTRLPARIVAMQKNATPTYFGIHAEDSAEWKELSGRVREWEVNTLNKGDMRVDWTSGMPLRLPPHFDDIPLIAPPPQIPTQAEVEQYLLELRRKRLLSQYE